MFSKVIKPLAATLSMASGAANGQDKPVNVSEPYKHTHLLVQTAQSGMAKASASELVKSLGANEFATREAAQLELFERALSGGLEIFSALQGGCKSSVPEVNRRSDALFRQALRQRLSYDSQTGNFKIDSSSELHCRPEHSIFVRLKAHQPEVQHRLTTGSFTVHAKCMDAGPFGIRESNEPVYAKESDKVYFSGTVHTSETARTLFAQAKGNKNKEVEALSRISATGQTGDMHLLEIDLDKGCLFMIRTPQTKTDGTIMKRAEIGYIILIEEPLRSPGPFASAMGAALATLDVMPIGHRDKMRLTVFFSENR